MKASQILKLTPQARKDLFFKTAKKVNLVKDGNYVDGIPTGKDKDINLFYLLEDLLEYPNPCKVPQENGYGVFLTIELARAKDIISTELEYDLTWETATGLYTEFENSKFNKDTVGLYDCIQEFLNSKK